VLLNVGVAGFERPSMNRLHPGLEFESIGVRRVGQNVFDCGEWVTGRIVVYRGNIPGENEVAVGLNTRPGRRWQFSFFEKVEASVNHARSVHGTQRAGAQRAAILTY
jgi:hypothetical protein